MKMKIQRYIIAVLLAISAISTETLAQQDPQFSQYMFAPLTINPAYAGCRGVMNGTIAARRQWVDFPGAPTTLAMGVNTPLRKGKVALGFEVMADQIGPKNTTGFWLDYAYRIRLGKGKLAFGLGAGMINFRLNWNEVEYKDNADIYASLGSSSVTRPDFKFGMFFNNKNFFIGLSTTHLNRAKYVSVQANAFYVSEASLHSFITFGRAFQAGEKFVFSPSVMLRSANGISQGNVDLNLNFGYNEVLWLGVSFRSEKAVVALVQYSITNYFKLGYSYDFTLNRLGNYESGSHELVIGFNFNLFQSQMLSPRFF
jgi:type IX secretion system PorP/SprF family membrane protein